MTERIKKVLTRWGELFRAGAAPLTVFSPIFAVMVLDHVLARFASDGYSVFGHPEWSAFGDSLLVLMLFLAALYFRCRWCAAAAAALAGVNLLLKTFALVLYRETFMSTDFADLKLLWEHTDWFAVRAVLGEYCLWWLIPAVAAVLAAVGGAGYLAWRTLCYLGRRQRFVWMVFAWALLALSVGNTIVFLCAEKRAAPEVYSGHLVRPLPVSAVYFVRDALREERQSAPAPLGAESRKLLEAMEVIPPAGTPTPPPAPARFDRIVIIALESLDLAYVRAFDPRMPEGVTPNLDRLCAEYPAMKNYFCAAQPTSWGLTGMLLSRFDFDRELEQPKKRPSLFTVAADRGYRTGYFSPMTGVFANNRRTYADAFSPEKMYFLEEWHRRFGKRRSFLWGISDRELYSCVLSVLRSWKKKRFVVLISTMDTHHPYTADGITEEEKERFPTPFLQALHTTDRHLGDFLRELMADNSLYDDRTLIVVTADHTATHGENYLDRKEYVPERVPLVFITPERRAFAALDRDKYASGIDLAPTLVEFIGGKMPASFMGRSLFSRKNLALSWMLNDLLLVRSPGGESRLRIGDRNSDPRKQALLDFFNSHY